MKKKILVSLVLASLSSQVFASENQKCSNTWTQTLTQAAIMGIIYGWASTKIKTLEEFNAKVSEALARRGKQALETLTSKRVHAD